MAQILTLDLVERIARIHVDQLERAAVAEPPSALGLQILRPRHQRRDLLKQQVFQLGETCQITPDQHSIERITADQCELTEKPEQQNRFAPTTATSEHQSVQLINALHQASNFALPWRQLDGAG